jgi:hypothetical protein
MHVVLRHPEMPAIDELVAGVAETEMGVTLNRTIVDCYYDRKYSVQTKE